MSSKIEQRRAVWDSIVSQFFEQRKLVKYLTLKEFVEKYNEENVDKINYKTFGRQLRAPKYLNQYLQLETV